MQFWTRWRTLHMQQHFCEDLRDLTQVKAINQIESFTDVLRGQVSQLTSYTSLLNHALVTIDTVRRWLSILQALYILN